ncbi:MAG: glycoside hydrolase family 43 protein [Lachnospiraceae bacterium]
MAEQNKPLVTHIFTADPSAHVFEGKLYIYPSHDVALDCPDDDNGDQYQMEDYHILSMDSLDAPCVDHGEVLHEKEVPWVSHQMWAPDAAYKNGKYYLFFPAKDKDGIFRIGVATSDSPAGKFTPQPDYIPGSHSIDPAVLIDDDGKAYMYVGGLWGGQLEKWQTGSYVENPKKLDDNEPALGPLVAEMTDDLLGFKAPLQEIKILDENGKPLLAGDRDRRFFEASWMHKYNDTYYFSYSTGDTHYLCYATGKSPMGPFTYRGRILEPVKGWTTHHSIVKWGEKWYLFYHDASLSGVNHQRCVKFTEIHYNEDGTIQTIVPYADEK